MPAETNCLTCSKPLVGKQLKFCCQKHAMKWHNDRSPWRERKDRHRKNALRKASYQSDPGLWQNKARAWRENNPEKSRVIALRAKEKYWASPWRRLVIAANGRAKKKNLPHDLTFEWAESRWTGFCELTKIPFSPRHNSNSSIFSPSIDRIIPSAGYLQSNCRFVLFGVNGLKHDGTDEAMYLVAEALCGNKLNLERTPQKVVSPESRY